MRRIKRLLRPTIKQSVWLAKRIWDRKMDILRKNGVTWQMLVSAARNSFPLALAWVIGKLSWEELIGYIDRQLESMIIVSGASR